MYGIVAVVTGPDHHQEGFQLEKKNLVISQAECLVTVLKRKLDFV